MKEEKHIHLFTLSLGCASDKQHKELLNKMSQLDDRMTALSTRVDEASAEILALLETLRNESLTETGRAALENAEAKIAGLADIVPNP